MGSPVQMGQLALAALLVQHLERFRLESFLLVPQVIDDAGTRVRGGNNGRLSAKFGTNGAVVSRHVGRSPTGGGHLG